MYENTKDHKLFRNGQHEFEKSKSCLIDLIAFEDEMLPLIGKGRRADVVLPGLQQGYQQPPIVSL